ncbi:MAG: hypothetical protein L3J37_08115 [Rhodobacteraceae bacterium]|nr:hypothetical protein [Paracoccaceae bacterium]
MSKLDNKQTLYDPVPKEDLALPPMVQNPTEESVGSLPLTTPETVEMQEALENLTLTL